MYCFFSWQKNQWDQKLCILITLESVLRMFFFSFAQEKKPRGKGGSSNNVFSFLQMLPVFLKIVQKVLEVCKAQIPTCVTKLFSEAGVNLSSYTYLGSHFLLEKSSLFKKGVFVNFIEFTRLCLTIASTIMSTFYFILLRPFVLSCMVNFKFALWKDFFVF